MKNKILKKIKEKKFVVGIVGLGYVGLPLAISFSKNNLPVIGFDVDQNKVNLINEGKSYIKHINTQSILDLKLGTKNLFTSNFEHMVDCDALLMCVPTPLNKYREPDMSFVKETTSQISKYLKKGQLVVLESTTYPGTTQELIIPILEKNSGLSSETDFYVAYSPEREDPGNKNFNTTTIPKVLGADGNDALEIATKMYECAIEKIITVSNTRTAEAVKLTENIFRSVNIAMVNELKVIYDLMDIDVHEVLDAADSKPFGFMKFIPGPGLGGHCIPIDPFYLTWKAKEFEKNTRFIELSGEINNSMPLYVLNKCFTALNKKNKSIKSSKILVIGLAYKPDIDDMRESPTFKVFDLLKKNQATFDYYDPYIPRIGKTREHMNYFGMKSIEFSKKIISSYDLVIILTNHSTIDYKKLYNWSNLILDSRNSFKDIKDTENKIFKA